MSAVSDVRHPDAMATRTALYRLYDADGDLIYIGITSDPDRRWKEHRKEMLWWPEVEAKALEWFDTRADVWSAEQAAIRSENPRYNKGWGGPDLPPGVPPQPWGARNAYQNPQLRPAYRLAWFTWRAIYRDAVLNSEERSALGR